MMTISYVMSQTLMVDVDELRQRVLNEIVKVSKPRQLDSKPGSLD